MALGLPGVKEAWVIAGNELLGAGHEGSGTKLLAQPRARHQPPKRCTLRPQRDPNAEGCSCFPSPGSRRLSQQRTEHLRSPQPPPPRSGKEENSHSTPASSRGAQDRQHQGSEPPQRYPNLGLISRRVRLSAAGSWILAAGRAPGAPCPQHSAGPATGAAHARRQRRIARARLVCGDGESHTGFLLKFKTRCTQRAKLTKGKLKKAKVQRWGTFAHHLRFSKGSSRFCWSADGLGNCKKETIKRESARPRTITPYCPRTPGTSAVPQPRAAPLC